MSMALVSTHAVEALRMKGDLVLPVNLPKDIDPAVLPSMMVAIEKAFVVMAEAGVLERADRLAELAAGFVEPSLELVEERVHRMRTIQEVFSESEWLTAEQLNALQATPPANKAHPAADWKRRGRVFSVNYRGKEYFARYQFDALYQPLTIVKDILAAFGDVADPWTLAAWFHFPSPWLVGRDQHGATNLAPKDALDRRDDVVQAAAKRRTSYAA
ncbi:MAG TPA: hypothetical protein VIP05_17140 [Burkholderiaceae bacterium]